jgi:hypothetical protein
MRRWTIRVWNSPRTHVLNLDHPMRALTKGCNPGRCLATPDLQDRDTGQDIEARRTRRARIHHEPAACLCHERDVGVPIDDDIGCITSDELLRLRRAGFVTMADVDRDARNFHVDRLPEPRVADFVGVAEDGVDGRDEAKLVEDFVAADVTGVEDQLNAEKGVVNFRTQQAMRVGNETEPMDGGGGMWDVGEPRSVLISAGPPGHLIADADVVEDATDDEIHQFLDALGTVVETGGRREHDAARSRQAEHVLQMNVAVRRLTRHDDERAPFLQHHVGRALDE